MQHFYDGQIRRYLTQTIRVLSNFVVKYGDGTLVRIPVGYGDADRQAANIVRQNTGSTLSSVPRISVYITGLDLDTSRLGDSSYVGKVHIRERDIDVDTERYTQGQGRNYTVERLMPTPFKLTMKADIWTANTDQKLQVLEQILVLFNPSLELQTTDNYIDWTSLSVLNLSGVNWSSRQVPVGVESPIDIATLTFETPIWISPPVKVKHLGVIHSIITSIYQDAGRSDDAYIEGLGHPLTSGQSNFANLLTKEIVTVTDYVIQVYNGQAVLLKTNEGYVPREPTLDIPQRNGIPINWNELFDKYPRKYVPGSTMIFLTQPNGTEVVGTVLIDPLNDTILKINWDSDTRPPDTDLASPGDRSSNGGRSLGTFDAIIDPTKTYPGSGMSNLESGDRFLIIEDIVDTSLNDPGAQGWSGFVAAANDIIEWDGSTWQIIFESSQESDTMIWQTNIYTGIQYVWNGVMWAKSFEGEYAPGSWRIEI
jgi:hypothetical protein